MSGHSSQRIAVNTTYLFISQSLTWGLSLAVAILMPRTYGPAGIGQYHLAGAVWALAALFIGFGTDVIITREIARDEGRTSALVTLGIALRVALYVFGFGGVILFAWLAGYSAETFAIIVVFGIANLVYQIGHIFNAALYGLERMGWISAVGIVTELISTVVIIALIFAERSLVAVAWVSVLIGAVRMGLLGHGLRRATTLKLVWRPNEAGWLLREGATIFVNRLVRNAYVQADVIIISLFVSETVVGWYSVAEVAFGALLFVPTLVGTAVFPSFTRLAEQNSAELQRLSRRALQLLLLAAVPIGLGTAVVATPLIVLVLGDDFFNAGVVLSWFGLVTILTSANTFLAQLLIAREQQNRLTMIMAIAVGLTIPIDLLLIPWSQRVWGNGALGGVWAYLITELFILVGSLRLLPTGFLGRETVSYVIRVGVAGIVMAGASWLASDQFLLWPIVIGVVVYGAMAVALRLVGHEEVALARNTASTIWQRLSGRFSAAPTG